MKFEHIIPWSKCVLATWDADDTFRKYMGINKREFYSIVYDPTRKTRKRILAGEKEEITVLDGEADAEQNRIIYPDIPERSKADHEVAHIYHLKHNKSLHKPNIRSQLDCMYFPVVTEAFAYAYQNRSYVTGGIKIENRIISNDDSSSKKSSLMEKLLAESIRSSAINLLDCSEIEARKNLTGDISELVHEKAQAAYCIGGMIGYLLFTDWSKPQSLGTEINESPREISSVIKIQTHQIEPGKRRRLLQQFFNTDLTNAGNYLLSTYEEHISPLLARGYQELDAKLQDRQ